MGLFTKNVVNLKRSDLFYSDFILNFVLTCQSRFKKVLCFSQLLSVRMEVELITQSLFFQLYQNCTFTRGAFFFNTHKFTPYNCYSQYFKKIVD